MKFTRTKWKSKFFQTSGISKFPKKMSYEYSAYLPKQTDGSQVRKGVKSSSNGALPQTANYAGLPRHQPLLFSFQNKNTAIFFLSHPKLLHFSRDPRFWFPDNSYMFFSRFFLPFSRVCCRPPIVHLWFSPPQAPPIFAAPLATPTFWAQLSTSVGSFWTHISRLLLLFLKGRKEKKNASLTVYCSFLRISRSVSVWGCWGFRRDSDEELISRKFSIQIF